MSGAADKIISSRLLIVQSKRILLARARAERMQTGSEPTAVDIQRLERALHDAHERYKETVIKWGAPNTPTYRLVAYSSLIAKAERLRSRLHDASGGDTLDRNQLQLEIRTLEQMIRGWREVLRTDMVVVA